MSNLWYAVMRDLNDDDWSYGSNNMSEAENMVEQLHRDGCAEAYIAVIAEGDNPVCLAEIH